MNIFGKFFGLVSHLFSNPKVKQAFELADHIATEALPIVKQIDALAPNRTVEELVTAYEHFGVPLVKAEVTGNPDQAGFLALNLATKALARVHVGVPTNVVQTAVQVAVTALHAEMAA